MTLEEEFFEAHKSAKSEIESVEEIFEERFQELKDLKMRTIQNICEKYGTAFATNNEEGDSRVSNYWYMPESGRKFAKINQQPALQKIYGWVRYRVEDQSENYDDDTLYYGQWQES